MKKRLVLAAMFSMVLALGMTLVGCDIGTDGGGGTTSTITVDRVTVSPPSASVAKGATQSFAAVVAGTGSPSQTVTWSITETGKKAETTIDATGLFTVAADEALTSLTVKATSTVDTTKSGTIAVTVTGGGSGDTVPVILNTVFIGTATTGNYSGKHFYIGNARTTNNTPSSVYSMAGYNLHLGSDWDNTPSWKSNIEYMISGYQLKKNNVLVSYTDLPDYNGTGARNNRNQHYVFSVATISTGNKIPVPVPTGNKIPVPAPTTNTETYFGRPGSDLGDEYYDYFISALNTGKWTYTTSFSEGKGVWTDSFQWVYYRAQKRLSVALCRTTDTGFTIYTINNVEETDLNY